MRSTKLLIALMLLSGLAVAQAPQQGQPGAVLPQGNMANPWVGILNTGGSGAMNFFVYNKSQLQSEYLAQVFKQRDADYKNFTTQVDKIEAAFRNILRTNVYDKDEGLKGLSDRTRLSNPPVFIPANEYMNKVNQFKAALETLDQQIEAITAAANGAFNPLPLEDVKGADVGKLPAYNDVSFEKIKTFYRDRMKAIELFASNLEQRVLLPGGADDKGMEHILPPNKGTSLFIATPAFALTRTQIADYRKKIILLMQWDENQEDTVNTYTKGIIRRVFQYYRTFGASERWRSMGNDLKQKRVDEAKWIADAFWTRSYLRALYGMPIGAICIPYKKVVANIDIFTTSVNALMAMEEQPVHDETKMMDCENAYRYLLRRADIRSEQMILKDDFTWVQSAENLVTFLSGQRNASVAAQTMLRLLAADLVEERKLMRGTVGDVMSIYRSRYATTDEDTVYYKRLQLSYDPEPPTADDIKEQFKDRPEIAARILDGFDPDNAQGGLGAGSNLRTDFIKVVAIEKDKSQDLARADEYKQLIANATAVTKYDEATQRRKKKL